MATYIRGAGDHIAEREQPEPGSDREKELERLVKAGQGDWTRVEEPQPEQGDGEPKRPAKSAGKDEWVAWAVAQGADEAEAKAAKKDALIEAYGG